MNIDENVKITNKILDVKLHNYIGDFLIGSYELQNKDHNEEVIIVYKEDTFKNEVTNVRINSACFTSDIFKCDRCDCNEQLLNALEYFEEKNNGLLIYLLNHEGRGIGITNKLKTYQVMDDRHLSTAHAFEYLNFELDERDYSSVIKILEDLNVRKVKILTNNPDKITYLEGHNINVIDSHQLISKNHKLHNYLMSKQRDFGHLIKEEDML